MMLRYVLFFVGLLGFSASAWAEGLGSLSSNVFPKRPCTDGWTACVVDGTIVNPDLITDDEGRPHPSDMRYGFFDLEPLPGLSPFGSLSAYEAVEPPASTAAEGSEVVATNGPGPDVGPGPRNENSAPVIETTNSAQQTRTETVTTVSNNTTTVESTNTGPEGVGTETNALATNSGVESTETSTGSTQPEVLPELTQEEVTCNDTIALQAPAMLGDLGADIRQCLEDWMASGPSQTDMDKISRLLIIDAQNRGAVNEWERLMERHLNDISRSDPDYCMTYAIHLYQSARYQQTIRWAEVALENKQEWSGQTYVSRVDTLYKLRARAANELWEAAAAELVRERNADNERSEERARSDAMNFAKEWLDYARASGQPTTEATEICVSAARTQDFCQ